MGKRKKEPRERETKPINRRTTSGRYFLGRVNANQLISEHNNKAVQSQVTPLILKEAGKITADTPMPIIQKVIEKVDSLSVMSYREGVHFAYSRTAEESLIRGEVSMSICTDKTHAIIALLTAKGIKTKFVRQFFRTPLFEKEIGSHAFAEIELGNEIYSVNVSNEGIKLRKGKAEQAFPMHETILLVKGVDSANTGIKNLDDYQKLKIKLTQKQGLKEFKEEMKRKNQVIDFTEKK